MIRITSLLILLLIITAGCNNESASQNDAAEKKNSVTSPQNEESSKAISTDEEQDDTEPSKNVVTRDSSDSRPTVNPEAGRITKKTSYAQLEPPKLRMEEVAVGSTAGKSWPQAERAQPDDPIVTRRVGAVGVGYSTHPDDAAAPVALDDEQSETEEIDRVIDIGDEQIEVEDAVVSYFGGLETAKPTGDWPQWGGSSARNNVPTASGIPSEWNVGDFDLETGEWVKEDSKNIKWAAKLGSQSYGNPVVAGGKVFVGTNNGAGYLKRFPIKVDLGCLVAFNEADGKFLWQHSSEKLKSGRVHDWPMQGICCAPLVEGDRLWFVTSRGEVLCLDTEGFLDDENDGPFQDEEAKDKNEADTVWSFDMMKQLGSLQHNMCSCSVTAAGDILFVATGNGVDESHLIIPAPKAPSFFALDKKTGKLLWSDASPGENILHGQWSSPAFGELGGVPQVIYGGGDGWVYSFRGDVGKDGKPELLWKFDANPKETKWILEGRGTRNNIIATPVIFDGKVFVAVGQDPEHMEGQGHLWCIDPTKRGDVSPTLAVKADDEKTIIPHKRIQAVEPDKGEKAIPNPNSAAVWHYSGVDMDGDGENGFEEVMHRSCGTVAIKDGLLFIADFSGVFHCLDVKTGKPHWTYDMLSQAWGSPLIVDGKVYIGAEDGGVRVFKLSKELEQLAEIDMGTSVFSTPIIADGVLYISSRNWLFAIEGEKKP